MLSQCLREKLTPVPIGDRSRKRYLGTDFCNPPASALRCVSLSNNRQVQGEASGRHQKRTLGSEPKADRQLSQVSAA